MIKASILELFGSIAIAFLGSVSRLNDKENHLSISLTYFFIYSCLLYSFKGVTSAHFNPLVTISLIITKQITFGKSLFYIFVQLLGSIIGGLMVKIFYVFPVDIEVFYYGEPQITEDHKLIGAILEMVGIFILVWTYNSIYENIKAPRHVYGVAIGGVYLVSIAGLGGISGGSLNLVSILGPSIFSGNFGDWLYYFPAHIIGAILSSLIYLLFLHGKSNEIVEEQITELESKKLK